MKRRPRVVFIVGPTASGKSAVALHLAERRACGFVSADAMQIYKGMDIVTDRPSPATRRRAPHALIGTVAPAREYNVAAFCRDARRAVRAILGRKRCPVVVGGTGLYIQALVDGFFEGPSADAHVRGRLEREAREKGKGVLHERLLCVDPVAAERIGPHNARRIIRALEVHELTGQPLSELQKNKKGLKGECDVLLFGLRREREDLYARIDRRVDAMLGRGLVDEVKSLLKKKLGTTAYCCIGIREVEGYLNGRYGLDEAVRLIKRNTRHFAKRQMTWFRKNRDIVWLDVASGADLARAACEIARRVAEAARPQTRERKGSHGEMGGASADGGERLGQDPPAAEP